MALTIACLFEEPLEEVVKLMTGDSTTSIAFFCILVLSLFHDSVDDSLMLCLRLPFIFSSTLVYAVLGNSLSDEDRDLFEASSLDYRIRFDSFTLSLLRLVLVALPALPES